ncbi:Protein deglycase DJ-1zDJ-1 [Desmophyllum pertusum]|uniref:Protein deglycase DJ-1zDJ-1 n=1 Tax=Desmophyllum pertusum TaxID=174260 RepID=A0A9X0CY00_9CNID|nr:Protein deglycase DJ-1zDJ-1 [Desmophyllum pertusum]
MADLKGSALVILAEGAEENGSCYHYRRSTAGKSLASADPVVCSRSVVDKPDMSLEDAVKQSSKVKEILQDGRTKSGRIIGAICSCPKQPFMTHELQKGKEKLFDNQTSFCYIYSEERVVRDGNLITSRGPGTAFEFGIELVRAVRGNDGEAEKTGQAQC